MSSFKRGAEEDYTRPYKRYVAQANEPTIRHKAHPDSGIGQNFHRVPYPLSLLPLESWTALHNNTDGAVCSQCRKSRALSAHQRKMFLVAERLSWDRKCLNTTDRMHNEEMLWAVNAELGIMEPVLHAETDTLGGWFSRGNEWFPWASEAEACVVMHLLHRAIAITEESFQAWKTTVEDELKASRQSQLAEGEPSSSMHRVPLTEVLVNRVNSSNSHRHHSNVHNEHGTEQPAWHLPTPPSSAENHAQLQSKDGNTGRSMETSSLESGLKIKLLTDVYKKLDKIERTSPMAAMFLETYAEWQMDEVCSDCWFKLHILTDEDLENEKKLRARPIWTRSKGEHGAASFLTGRHDEPSLSKAVLDSLAKLDDRGQTAEWLKRCYKADPEGRTCMLRLQCETSQAFHGCKGGGPSLSQRDFKRTVDELWPDSRREPTAGGQVLIRISRREQCIDVGHAVDAALEEEDREVSHDARSRRGEDRSHLCGI